MKDLVLVVEIVLNTILALGLLIVDIYLVKYIFTCLFA